MTLIQNNFSLSLQTITAKASADKALQAGSVDALAEKIGKAVGNEIKKRFIEVSETKKHGEDSVEGGDRRLYQ